MHILINITPFLEKLRAEDLMNEKNDCSIIYKDQTIGFSISFLEIAFSATMYYLPSNKIPKPAIINAGMVMKSILIIKSIGYSNILRNDSFYPL